jgi:hypothetical protein
MARPIEVLSPRTCHPIRSPPSRSGAAGSLCTSCGHRCAGCDGSPGQGPTCGAPSPSRTRPEANEPTIELAQPAAKGGRGAERARTGGRGRGRAMGQDPGHQPARFQALHEGLSVLRTVPFSAASVAIWSSPRCVRCAGRTRSDPTDTPECRRRTRERKRRMSRRRGPSPAWPVGPQDPAHVPKVATLRRERRTARGFPVALGVVSH